MEKVMRIGTVKLGRMSRHIFVRATYHNGKLSMCGVIGPKSNGNCFGSCGQIQMGFMHRNAEDNDKRYHHLTKPEEIKFAPGWDAEKWLDFLDIWAEWHLNDMKAGCEHQREMKWDKLPELEIVKYSIKQNVYSFVMNAVDKAHGDASRIAMAAVIDAGLSPYDYKAIPEKKMQRVFAAFADKRMVGFPEDTILTRKEKKSPMWTTEKEHPQGVLSKACPVCGYRYGSKWLSVEVPESVIQFLENLPDTDITPAWV